MKDWIRELRIEDLPEPYYSIAEQLGIDVALEITEMFQGSQIYFPKLENVCNERRKELIVQEFDGYNFKELSQKYGYSERWIRKICEDKIARERNKPLDGQINFGDMT